MDEDCVRVHADSGMPKSFGHLPFRPRLIIGIPSHSGCCNRAEMVGKAPKRRRVTAGDCSPAVPADPDVPDSGIRLLGLDLRYVA